LQKAENIWQDLRPYVATMGTRFYNPLHIGSIINEKNIYIPTTYDGFRPRSFRGNTVFGLTAFEYMRKEGMAQFLADPSSEWDSVRFQDGFNKWTYFEFLNNKDFQHFQEDFLDNFWK
jgi:hypothetical protein